MDMANSIYWASETPNRSLSLQPYICHPSLSSLACFARRSTVFSSPSLSLRSNARPVPVAMAAANAVEVERRTAAATPSRALPFRVGHGFDLHRLEPGYPLIIGGINIPHERGCEAHSDGDVLLHCVVDANFGAFGLPDIGQIFTDSDPKWKGAPSSVFIKEAGWHLLLPAGSRI